MVVTSYPFSLPCVSLSSPATLVTQRVKSPPAMQETRVWSLGWEDSLENEMATHSSILAWRISWMEEPGGLQSIGLQRVGHNWVTSLHFTSSWKIYLYFWDANILSSLLWNHHLYHPIKIKILNRVKWFRCWLVQGINKSLTSFLQIFSHVAQWVWLVPSVRNPILIQPLL